MFACFDIDIKISNSNTSKKIENMKYQIFALLYIDIRISGSSCWDAFLWKEEMRRSIKRKVQKKPEAEIFLLVFAKRVLPILFLRVFQSSFVALFWNEQLLMTENNGMIYLGTFNDQQIFATSKCPRSLAERYLSTNN